MAVAVIVEDNEKELEISVATLKRMALFEAVHGFSCPESACLFVKEKGCDVLFVETEIRGMNCFFLINKVREISKDIAHVIMAADENYAFEAFQKGVMDYILKPLSFEGVTKTLKKIKRYPKC